MKTKSFLTLKNGLLLFALLIQGLLTAQSINVSVTILPPYDPNLFTYTDDEDKVLITVQNISGTTQNIKLKGTFRSLDGRISVETNPDYQPPAPITLNAGETRMLNANDLYNIFPDENSIIASGISREELIRTRRLPANNYQLCITAYDYNSPQYTVPLSAAIPSGCSAAFRVGLINAPQMLSFGGVNCGERLNSMDVQNFLIQWTMPPELPVGGRYVLEMIELYPENRNPYDAFESATTPLFFTDSVESLNTYFYTAAQPALESGRSYAIRVRVVDPSGRLRFANSGNSTPCVIRYGENNSGNTTLASNFPTNNEYIPWRYFPIIVRFSPYDNHLYQFDYDLQLFANGTSNYTHHDNLRWPYGPAESQTRSTGITITEDASRNIAVNEPNSGVLRTFTRGANYRYNVGGYFLHRSTGDRHPVNVACDDEFISGIGIPLPQQPANQSVQEAGEISFRFQTAQPPINPVPEFAIVSSAGSRTPTSNFYNQGVEERYVLEVSRQSDFSSVVRSISRRFSPNIDLIQCIENRRLLNDSIYKSINHSFSFTDTGLYYWRIKWVENDADSNSRAYATSEVWQFRIGAAAPEITPDTARRTPPGCLADCMAPTVTDRTGVATARVGGTVTVGKFTMTLTEISWSGTNASGRGHMRVPFMNAPVKVSFSNIQINAANQLISGDVLTETDNSALVPDAIARATGVFTGMSETQGQEINEWITTTRRLASQLVGSEPVGMPMGIDNTIDGQRITVGILGCKFTSTMATLNAVISLDVPELHGWLSLGANDICFHPGGLNMGQGKLYLPLDKDLVYTDAITLTLKSPSLPRDSGTYVSWDCQGFKELSISGTVTFGRELLVPDANDGSAGPGQVQGRFGIKVQRMGNWVCRLDMDRFQVAGLPEWGFEASEAYLDFSDLQNAGSMQYPEGYGGDRTAHWKGFYLKRLAVRLPHQFRTYSEPTRRLTGSITNVLIDGTGFSARFAIENLVRVEEGNLDGWAYSLDTVYMSFVSNNFRNAGLAGEVRLPISDRDELKYNASLNRSSSGEFSFEFRIQPKDTFMAQIWEAQLSLLPTSRISIIADSRGFAASTDLSGRISISGNRGRDGGAMIEGLSFVGITFEHFALNSRGPRYISIGHFAFASPQHSAGGFPLSISDINITNREGPSMMEFDQSPGTRFGIEFNLNLSLTGESSGFHATGKIALLGKLSLSGERQGWTFSGINLDSIAVGGSVGCVTIEGALAFYNSHPTYGKGIKGYLRVEMQPTIRVSATVQFGEVRGFRYWYVDAMATWSPGITLFTGIDLRGLGGGAWYHMSEPAPVPFSSIVNTSGPRSTSAGSTSSGISYTPDNTIGLGFKVMVKIGATGGSSAYHGLITLGAQFIESTGGIERIYLRGDFIFMTESDNRREASASADFNVEYNFVTETFQANFNVYVNVQDILVGVNENNLAGRMEILVSPATWHIYVGEPTVPVGLRLQLGSTRIAEARFYFMVGLNLPPMPPLPDRIASILNIRIERDITNIERGDGFAMGTYVGIGPLSLEVMPFYARIELGFGFDLSVKKYTTRCEGMAPGETMGADGWYARGQIYGYFDASMGLFVDLFFVKGRFEILRFQAAAYLQGGFPNPNWVEGAIAGRYSILGGAIQGDCNFQFSQGQKCVPPVENPMTGMELVADLAPENFATNVDCGVEPTALYNYSINREFSLTVFDINNNPVVRTFRVKEKNTTLSARTLTNYIGGRKVMSEDNKLITFATDSFLPARTAHFWTTTAYAEENIRGTWSTSRDLEGRNVEKKYTHLFVTGDRPNYIRPQDVLYSFPLRDQRFFLQAECRNGMIALKRSMAYLFTRASNDDYVWVYKAVFTPLGGGDQVSSTITNTSSQNLYFDVPNLLNSKVYKLEVVATRTLTAFGRARQAIAASTNYRNASIRTVMNITRFGGSTIEKASQSVTAGTKSAPNTEILYTYYFKTSQFNTIAEKWNSFTNTQVVKTGWGELEYLTYKANGEGFDEYDVNGFQFERSGVTNRVWPLVSFGGEWNNAPNSWMRIQNEVIYGFRDFLVRDNFSPARFRDMRHGIPPTQPVNFSDDYVPVNLLLAYEKVESSGSSGLSFANIYTSGIGSGSGIGRRNLPGQSVSANFSVAPDVSVYYGVPVIVRLHWQEARNMASRVVAMYGLWGSEFLTLPQQRYLAYVLNTPYTKLFSGSYPVKVYYTTPTCYAAPDEFETFKHRFNFILR